MRHRKIWIRILCASSVIGAATAGAIIGHWPGALLGVLASTVGAGVIAPVRDDIKNFIEKFEIPQCRILIFAHPGTGKSQLCKRLLGRDDFVHGEKPTRDPDVVSDKIEIGDKQDRQAIQVSIFDYAGQKPSQVTGELGNDFFGQMNNRRVDALFFVVDALPLLLDDLTKKQISDEELLRRCKDNPELLSKRAWAADDYIGKWNLVEVFDKAYNPKTRKPRAVRLLVNKVDLLRQIVADRYVEESSVDQFVDNHFGALILRIEMACQQNQIGDFSCEFVSAATGENTQNIVPEILQTYFKRGK